jgi:hypothetical protein
MSKVASGASEANLWCRMSMPQLGMDRGIVELEYERRFSNCLEYRSGTCIMKREQED